MSTERATRIRERFFDLFFNELGLSDEPDALAADYIRGYGLNSQTAEKLRESATAEITLREKKRVGAWSVPHLTVEKIDDGTFRLVGWNGGHTLIEDMWEGGVAQLLDQLPVLKSSFCYSIEDSELEKLRT